MSDADPTMPEHGPIDADAPTTDDLTPDVSAPAPEISSGIYDDKASGAGQPEISGYRITAKLGQGGMGVVWRAVQESPQREVELAARLEHPHIARVYDSGKARGVQYYAMQLVDGQTLDRHVQQHQPSREQLLVLMRDIALAVQHAHQRGMIHRDLKPANILVRVDDDGRASPGSHRNRTV